ncbi:MAG: four helix bundle protein [Proteobacteria bacterium]|nr:four helix bundle protein [Pseudomonadota bacterium]
MESNSYNNLEIYQLSHQLAVSIHKFSFCLPKHELYGIGNQIRTSSKSISVNIVEGYGRRRYKADFIRFLVYAQSSCDETIEWLKYINDCYEELSDEANKIHHKLNELGRKINRFIDAVVKGHRPISK